VTVKYALRPSEPRLFDEGTVSFVLGGGGYLEGLHTTVGTMQVGEAKTGVAIDSGFGEYIESGVATLDISQAPAGLKTGMSVLLQLEGGKQKARVTEMTDETFTLDANHPLAGKQLELDVELVAVDAGASAHEVATFAGGCFWGVELAYQREPGVVGTAVGYTQGSTEAPSYEQVCSGTTGHTEAVQVVFNPDKVSFARLCELLIDRLGENVWRENQVGNDRGTQYRHGIYPHSVEQRAVAEQKLAAIRPHPGGLPVRTEVVTAAKFWDGEDYHQQYLQKGGQDARKGAEETIRCYG